MNTNQTIWFWGDSWSVPNYIKPMPNYRARYHTSQLLADLGFTVICNGENGNGNRISIDRSHLEASAHGWRADWIIWFHTAVFRDAFNSKYEGALSERMPRVAEDTYHFAQEVVELSGAKLIVVEGHAPVYEPYFSNIVKTHTFINNWRGRVLGRPDLPQSHWYSQYHELLDDSALSTEAKEHEVQILDQIVTAVSDSPLFVDNTHPGDIAHLQLTSTLLDIIAAG